MNTDKFKLRTEEIIKCENILSKLSSKELNKKYAKTLLKDALSIYSRSEALFKGYMEDYVIEYSDDTTVEEILDELKEIGEGADKEEKITLEVIEYATMEFFEIKKLFLEIKESAEYYNNFNKIKCMKNIRTLVERSDNVRIGDIEDEANISRGTTSRYENIKNNTEPSVEYIASAAKMLNVSIDSLINMDFSKLPMEEDLIFQFIQKLIKYTDEGKMCWESLSIYDSDGEPLDIDGIIEIDYVNAEIGFYSDYYPEGTIYGNYIYRTEMPESENLLLYFIPCTMKGDIYYEMYFIDKDLLGGITRQNICCSLDLSHYVQVYVENLRDAIIDNSKKKGMNKGARNNINKFLNYM